MRAGTLRQRITLQQPVRTVDTAYGPQTDFQDVHTVWASVLGTEGNETSTAGAVTATTIYIVSLRYFPGLTSQWRITWGSKILDIISVIDPDGRKRQLDIRAVENQSNG